MTARPCKMLLAAGAVALLGASLALPGGAWSAPRRKPATMVVTFAIENYQSWRPVFDAAAPAREQDGVTNGRVYRNADRPNELLVLFDVSSAENGRKWMTSSAVRAAWKKGGVVGEPAFRFTR